MSKFLFLFVLVLVSSSDAAKILGYFPIPSVSHQVVFRSLMLELARRGHEVVTITTDPAFPKGKAPANLTEIDVHDISYGHWVRTLSALSSPGTMREWAVHGHAAFNAILDIVDTQLSLEEVKAVIDESNKYDLLILESCAFGTLALTHFFKGVPAIHISSFGALYFNLKTVGAPMHLFHQPYVAQNRISQLSLWEKLEELLVFQALEDVYNTHEVKSDIMLKRKYGPDFPELKELKNNVDMLFLNVHPLWEMNRPMPPNVVYMGGLHQITPKEIPQDLKSYLDSSKNGVIYVSFGTNVDPAYFPADKLQILVNTFSKLPFDVLWKWNHDELPGRTANIRISKWLPQADLLRHPKVKLFITQAGLQSTDEAITAGVPLIGIPMLGDQWYNADLYVYHKIGMRVDFPTATEEILTNAINTITKDDSYRKNIVKLRSVMRDEVQTPLERAVWWTEYVLRHGGAKHLRSPLANLSWAEYLELDLVLVIFAALISILLVSLVVLYSVYKFVWRLFHKNSKLKGN